ncbi:jg11493 [Pararge aegeria aegeria]|uniref:Jg11493 protein n=1 Tax=Pararge aegeria aegeria TaxID=348720 RepID=A0A8S4RJX6_9NEOP|nr:jg11493 [Pararge aegeria aegeria]
MAKRQAIKGWGAMHCARLVLPVCACACALAMAVVVDAHADVDTSTGNGDNTLTNSDEASPMACKSPNLAKDVGWKKKKMKKVKRISPENKLSNFCRYLRTQPFFLS